MAECKIARHPDPDRNRTHKPSDNPTTHRTRVGRARLPVERVEFAAARASLKEPDDKSPPLRGYTCKLTVEPDHMMRRMRAAVSRCPKTGCGQFPCPESSP